MQIERRGYNPTPGGTGNLADILERVLDKGIVVAGDIRVNLLDIELLTIKLRLLIASADTARQMGIDWWRNDPFLTGDDRPSLPAGSRSDSLGSSDPSVADRLERIEAALEALAGNGSSSEEAES
ncbi:MAG TPA: gas vesicle protein [Acidimicrobiales bacterium]|nr:gas vesicle protein [Acidimicrobiales bacterium]